VHSINWVVTPSLPYPQSKQPELTLIQSALNGEPKQQYRVNAKRETLSLMSASPVYDNQKIVGVIVYEQTLETLYNRTLRHFHLLVGTASLIGLLFLLGILIYASTLSNRILALAKDVNESAQANYSLVPLMREPIRHDEMGALRKSMIEILKKIKNYEHYLKQLPKTLRHELHNPINRLSATLELMEMEDATPRVASAQQSLHQLKQIINALSEASSLEDSIEQTQTHPITIVPKLIQYFKGVEQSLPSKQFKLDNRLNASTQNAIQVIADRFLLEQLFDKLIDNAISFSNFEKPITVNLTQKTSQLVIEVINTGPLLPSGFEQQIFDGMVSIRPFNQTNETHLGLGLHLVKLIASLHQAKIQAYNLPDQSGVCFELTLPIKKIIQTQL
jgi:signal transduction histidine kinase